MLADEVFEGLVLFAKVAVGFADLAVFAAGSFVLLDFDLFWELTVFAAGLVVLVTFDVEAFLVVFAAAAAFECAAFAASGSTLPGLVPVVFSDFARAPKVGNV